MLYYVGFARSSALQVREGFSQPFLEQSTQIHVHEPWLKSWGSPRSEYSGLVRPFLVHLPTPWGSGLGGELKVTSRNLFSLLVSTGGFFFPSRMAKDLCPQARLALGEMSERCLCGNLRV